MSRYSVAIVLLSLIAGGAAGIVYENARQRGAAAQGVAETEAQATTEPGTGEVAPAGRVEVLSSEVMDESEVAAVAPVARAVRRAASVRKRDGQQPVRADSRPATASGYVRVTRREAGGGRGVAGHVAGGVKKTGAVVSKPFVKVGGLFHD